MKTRPTLVAGRRWIEVGHVSRPTMTVYSPAAKNTGAAVVVFPGGGYQILAIDLEGTEVCDWLTSRGITCVLLKYRVPGDGLSPKSGAYPRSPMALEDAQRAHQVPDNGMASAGRDVAGDDRNDLEVGAGVWLRGLVSTGSPGAAGRADQAQGGPAARSTEKISASGRAISAPLAPGEHDPPMCRLAMDVPRGLLRQAPPQV
jgi:hypothetical protein